MKIILFYLTLMIISTSCSIRFPEEDGKITSSTRVIKNDLVGMCAIITIDSCEYVFVKYGYRAGLSHKGNCKFCAERNKGGTVISEKKAATKTKSISNDDEIKPGQVWVYERNKGNPFEDHEKLEYKVLSVQDNYVKYEVNGRIRSNEIYWFKIGSHRIK